MITIITNKISYFLGFFKKIRIIFYFSSVLFFLLPQSILAKETFEIKGNILFPDELYKSIIYFQVSSKMIDNLEPTKDNAYIIGVQLQKFLRQIGYSIASVKTEIQDNTIVIFINEGKLKRVLFFGEGGFTTLRIKLGFKLPYLIYHRPTIQKELDKLFKLHDILNISFKLVKEEDLGNKYLGLNILTFQEEDEEIENQEEYVLQIFLNKTKWRQSLNFSLKGYESQLFINADYHLNELFYKDDHFIFGMKLGFKDFKKDTKKIIDKVNLSFLGGEINWYMPKIAFTYIRPIFNTSIDLIVSERFDLNIPEIVFFRQLTLLSLGYEFTNGLILSLGFGMQFLEYDMPEKISLIGQENLIHDSRYLFLSRLQTEFIFDTNTRFDQSHILKVSSDYFLSANNDLRLKIKGEYQKYFYWKFHDIILKSKGLFLRKQNLLFDEVPVSNYIRGISGINYRVKNIISGTLEFRFSLLGDIIKISFFNDTAYLHIPNYGQVYHGINFFTAFGNGLHILFYDIIQLNMFYALGYIRDKPLEKRLSFNLAKAF